jgi:hypothetical protein
MKNRYEVRGGSAVIFIPYKKETILECLIDSIDLKLISQCSWTAQWSKDNQSFYAQGRHPVAEGRKVGMQQVLVPAISGLPVVDHLNHNTLDNRRTNLSRATHSANSLNRKGPNSNHPTGHRNSTRRKNGRWQARMMIRGKNYFLGCHNTPELASVVAKEARERIMQCTQ